MLWLQKLLSDHNAAAVYCQCCNVTGEHSAAYQTTPTSIPSCSFKGIDVRLICMIPPAHMGRGIVVCIQTDGVHVEDSTELPI
jgi:hypothetical protein